MNTTAGHPSLSPKPLHLLIASLPPRILLSFVKSDDVLARTVLQGFSAREGSMKRPVVRQRLEHALEKQPELATRLLESWMDLYRHLMQQLNTANFTFSASTLHALLKDFGAEALEYALLHTQLAEAQSWASRMAEIRTFSPTKATVSKVHVEEQAISGSNVNAKLSKLQRQVRDLEQERDALKRETTSLDHQLRQATERESLLQKRLEREQRRAKKAEEEITELRRSIRKPPPPAPPEKPAPPQPAKAVPQIITVMPPEVTVAIEQAIGILQQSLKTPASPTPLPAKAQPVKQVAKAEAPVHKALESTITLAKPRGKVTYSITQIITAFRLNDVKLIDTVRDGLARLAGDKEKERTAINALVQAGIPKTVLIGPIRPAVVDASNITNMSPQRKARLAYLEQIRRSAWEEGYFPVIIIADASLPYQIDQPDLLLEMVERGEIEMAPAGTSADALLIEEAQRLNATLITNDRMTDWPEAKKLEKRHAEMHNNVVTVGSLHRSAGWFQW